MLWPFKFSRTSVVQFRASRYSMRLNWTSVWKVMTICISLELPLFNFERLDMWCPGIGHPSEKLWPFEFIESFIVQFWASQYVIHLNRTSGWKVMTIWISSYLPLFNFEPLDLWSAWIGHPSEKLWPFEFLWNFRCSISSVSIYYAPESHLRVNSYDHFNFSRASVVQFRGSQYMMSLNRTSEWKVMTIWIA